MPLYCCCLNQAKVTDFGLHKRARYNRAEEALVAVAAEWSAHGQGASGAAHWPLPAR
jgi:hypothetical protein